MNQVIKFAETHPEFKESSSKLVAKMGPARDAREGGLRERGFGLRVMDYLTMPPEKLQEQLNINKTGDPITTEQATWTQKALAYVKNPKKFKELLTQTAPSKRKLILENIRELGLGAQIPKVQNAEGNMVQMDEAQNFMGDISSGAAKQEVTKTIQGALPPDASKEDRNIVKQLVETQGNEAKLAALYSRSTAENRQKAVAYI